jgi:3-dehydroquinate synthase
MEINALRGRYTVDFVERIVDLDIQLKSTHYDLVLFDKNLLDIGILSTVTLSEKPSLGLDASEESKSFIAVNEVLEWLSENSANRGSNLLVIGGGAIQDIATFACSIFHRGIGWIYVPTTLLAQCDSSIGGKCGINLGSKKNQVGVVYPPNRIITVHEFLKTLPINENLSGIGEMIKLSLTDSGQFWNQMKDYLDGGQTSLQELIKLSLDAKRLVIEEDEFEANYRKVLNYGHTFGHALESISNYMIPHGIAVLFGMKIIHKLGVIWGESNPLVVEEIDSYINRVLMKTDVILPTSTIDVFESIKKDKKIRNGEMTFVILQEVGKLKLVTKKIDSVLQAQIKEALETL